MVKSPDGVILAPYFLAKAALGVPVPSTNVLPLISASDLMVSVIAAGY